MLQEYLKGRGWDGGGGGWQPKFRRLGEGGSCPIRTHSDRQKKRGGGMRKLDIFHGCHKCTIPQPDIWSWHRSNFMNLTSKTPSNVQISVKGNLTIKASEILFVFHNVIYSRFIGLVESFNPKSKLFFKRSNKNSKNGY